MSSDVIKQELLGNSWIFKNHTEKQIKRVSKKKIGNDVIRIFKSTITDEQWLVVSYDGDNEDLGLFPYAEINDWIAYIGEGEDWRTRSIVPEISFSPKWWNNNDGIYDQHIDQLFYQYLKVFTNKEYEEEAENLFSSKIGNLDQTIADLKSRGFQIQLVDEDFNPIN